MCKDDIGKTVKSKTIDIWLNAYLSMYNVQYLPIFSTGLVSEDEVDHQNK